MKAPIGRPAPLLLAAALFILINLTTLTQYPPAHSDEAWLAGLSKAYLQSGTPYVTEPFFDLMPRQPHLIKSLFHSLQAAFIGVFGYSLFGIRLLSLCGAALGGYLMLRLLDREAAPGWAPALTLLFLLNPQVHYAGRLGRQEILLMCVLLAALLLLKDPMANPEQGAGRAGALVGLAIGLHPNAFIIALMVGSIILWEVTAKGASPAALWRYSTPLAVFAAAFVLLSLWGNPLFFWDYWEYGRTLSVDAGAAGRLQGLGAFYLKLWGRISGTYYLPELRGFFAAALLLVGAALAVIVRCLRLYPRYAEDLMPPLMQLVGFNLGIFIIGRYNPTAILFAVPPVFLLAGRLAFRLPWNRRMGAYLTAPLVLLSVFLLRTEAAPFPPGAYAEYEAEIRGNLPPDARVLGNLSSGFAFQDRPFWDIRNLAYLKDTDLLTYLQDRDINTLVHYEEYDYIHRNPQWQILYGDDSGYYDDLMTLIDERGFLLHRFESPFYGTRIIRYMGDHPWTVSIYRISPFSGNAP